MLFDWFEIDSYIQQLRNCAHIPYFHIAYFSLHAVNEKYLLILSEYFMPKSSSDFATDFIPIVAWYSYEQTWSQGRYIQYKNNDNSFNKNLSILFHI